MSKYLIIHDLQEDKAKELFGKMQEASDSICFSTIPAVKPCLGCFKCWTKTPGKCIIADRNSDLPIQLAQCEKMIIISRQVYGGYSPEVKASIDRMIPYLLPYFRIVNGEMHHTMRYDKELSIHVHFYGGKLEEEEAIGRKLVKGNAVNLGAEQYSVSFYPSVSELKEVFS